MEIQRLVDELEAIVNKGFRLPFTSNILVNEDDLYDVLDQIRISIPQEIKEAKRTEAERERILAHAQEEANRLVDMAKEKVMTAVDGHEVTDEAKSHANQLLLQTQREAQQLKDDADQYVADHLSDLEEHLLKLLTTVRNGIRHVQEQPTASGNPTPSSNVSVEETVNR